MTDNPKIKVGILGATGAVGQRFAQLIADHPYFEIAALTASDRSVGKRYREAWSGCCAAGCRLRWPIR